MNGWQWQRLAMTGTPPCPRQSHAAATVGNFMVIVGGLDASYQYADTWLLDLTKNAWYKPKVSGGDGFEPRGCHSLARAPDSLAKNSLLLFGGLQYAGHELAYDYFNDIWLLEIDSSTPSCPAVTYTLLAAQGEPPAPRAMHGFEIIGETAWVVGGTDAVRTYNDVFSFDCKTRTWTRVTTTGVRPPTHEYEAFSSKAKLRPGHRACVVWDKKIFVHGGIGEEGRERHYGHSPNLYCLDTVDGKTAHWSHVAVRWPSRAWHNVIAVKPQGTMGLAVILGGKGAKGDVVSAVHTMEMRAILQIYYSSGAEDAPDTAPSAAPALAAASASARRRSSESASARHALARLCDAVNALEAVNTELKKGELALVSGLQECPEHLDWAKSTVETLKRYPHSLQGHGEEPNAFAGYAPELSIPRAQRSQSRAAGARSIAPTRMEDGIAEATVGPTPQTAFHFYDQDYKCPVGIEEFITSLPEDLFPPQLLQEMLSSANGFANEFLRVNAGKCGTLGREDLVALYTYTYELYLAGPEKIACDHQIYRHMNKAMRENDSTTLSLWRPYIFLLDAALAKLPQMQNVKVFRGMGLVFDRSTYMLGEEVCWPAFSSSSLEKSVAEEFIQSHAPEKQTTGTVFIITSASARTISLFSHFPEEKEVLFSSNSRFRVVSVMGDDTKALLGLKSDIIEMTEIS